MVKKFSELEQPELPGTYALATDSTCVCDEGSAEGATVGGARMEKR